MRRAKSVVFDADCTDCPRLAGFLVTARQAYPDYFCRPVPSFGDPTPRLLIVGLAPGLHGANRTGRPFTGDYAGVLLYETLHEFGYADRATSVAADDGLELSGCRITNAVKCVPPANKPEPAEIARCNGFLKAELAALPARTRVLALGQVAHGAVLKALGLRQKDFPFGHGATHQLPSPTAKDAGDEGATASVGLYDSYHCSRYNTQTRRLTPAMFKAVFARIRSDME